MVIPLRKTLGTGAFLRPDVLFEFHLVQCQQHPAVRIDDLGVIALQAVIIPAAPQLEAPGHQGAAQQRGIRETDETDAAQAPFLRPERPPFRGPARGTVSSMMRQAACTMASTAASKLQ